MVPGSHKPVAAPSDEKPFDWWTVGLDSDGGEEAAMSGAWEATVACERSLAGRWFYNHGRSYYDLIVDEHGDLDEAGEDIVRIYYSKQLVTGKVLRGVLQRIVGKADGDAASWTWDAQLSNLGRIRFRREGDFLASSYCPASSSSWHATRRAEWAAPSEEQVQMRAEELRVARASWISEISGIAGDLEAELRSRLPHGEEAGQPSTVGVLELEAEVKKRLTAEEREQQSGILGASMSVTLCEPRTPAFNSKGAVVESECAQRVVDFADGLGHAYRCCRDSFERDLRPDSTIMNFSLCVWHIFNSLASFVQFRFEKRACPHFQMLINLFVSPDIGVCGIIDQWISVRHDGDDAHTNLSLSLRHRMERAIQSLIACMMDSWELLATLDEDTKALHTESLRKLKTLLRPLEPHEADRGWLALLPFPSLPEVRVLRLTLQSGTAVLAELRAAFADPLLRFRTTTQELPEGASNDDVAAAALRKALFKPSLILQKHGFQANRAGMRDLCANVGYWATLMLDGATRKLCRDIHAVLGNDASSGDVLLARSAFKSGESVLAFYNSNDHPQGYRYVAIDRGSGQRDAFPVVGITHGWLMAVVVGIAEPDITLVEGFGRVRVRFEGRFCDPYEVSRAPKIAASAASASASWLRPCGGSIPNWKDAIVCEVSEAQIFRGEQRQVPEVAIRHGLELSVPTSLVRKLSDPPTRPLLSIFCLRWFDYWSDERWSDYNVLNDGMLVDLFEGPCSPRQQLPGQYEVLTAFVRETADLGRLDPAWVRTKLRGSNVAAWYHLWPEVYGQVELRPGGVCERDFFAFCQSMERMSIRTCWPHESHLYRLLCGKLWVPQMCLHRAFRVPPTTRVHYAECREHCQKAAARALDCLIRLRFQVWGSSSTSPDNLKGVVKLGFSWCGADVLPFRGAGMLATTLQRLFEQPGSEQTVALVQERITNIVGEYRVLCLRDKLCRGFRKEAMWMYFGSSDAHSVHGVDLDGFLFASPTVVLPRDVVKEVFHGDSEARRAAEAEASQLVDQWLGWFRTESSQLPHCVRLDFLVAYRGPGKVEVWTCEVGECGASLCSVEVHGRNVAALNRAIEQGGSGRFPTALPRRLPRNDGWKSR